MRAVARQYKYRNKQTDCRAATAYQHETVEKFFRENGLGGKSFSQSFLVCDKSRRKVRLHDGFERVAAVYTEKPQKRGQKYEEETLEKSVRHACEH